jgi:peptidoglycan/LPS O-acetylase OafA/YrhL
MSSTRFLNLDALRGISALLVIWQHVSELFILNKTIAARGTFFSDIAETVDFGRIGVMCFFLISGFVIPYSLNRNAVAPVKTFFIRRFFRLYPTYWVSLIAAVALSIFLFKADFFLYPFLANITMAQGLFGFANIQAVYWTLTVEFLFYLICAVAFFFHLLDRAQDLLLFCWICLGFFVAWHLLGKFNPQLISFHSTVTYIPYCLSVMFCGSIIRHCYVNQSDYFLGFLAVASVFGLPVCILILGFMDINLVKVPTRFAYSHLIALFVFFSTLFFVKKPPWFLLKLGVISYSLYLFHALVMQIVHWAIQQPWAGGFAKMPLWFYIFSITLMTVIVSVGTYFLIEKPSIALGRILSRSFRERKFQEYA